MKTKVALGVVSVLLAWSLGGNAFLAYRASTATAKVTVAQVAALWGQVDSETQGIICASLVKDEAHAARAFVMVAERFGAVDLNPKLTASALHTQCREVS